MLSVNGLFQLDWDLSPVNKLQSAIHFVAQSYHLFGTLSQMLQHGARDQAAYFFSRNIFPEGCIASLQPENWPPGPAAALRAPSVVCKLHFIFLDEFSR